MRPMRWSWNAAGRVAAALWILASAGAAGQTVSNRFEEDVAALSAEPHRLAATESARRAAQYVARRLGEIGCTNVIVQRFRVPASRTEATLHVGGRTLALHALRANFWQAPTGGGSPIEGQTLWAGDGEPADYDAESVEGRIILLAYESARRWRDAFAMGARAVILVSTGKVPQGFPRHDRINADLPRFFIRREDAEAAGLLDGSHAVSIEARAEWSAGEAANVLAWIPGTDPVFDLGAAAEAVVLSAQLDTFGPVPRLTPGVIGAANCAALLQTVAELKAHPPRRSVLVAFLGAEGRLLSGSAALYDAIFRERPYEKHTRTHTGFIVEHREEMAFLREMIDVFESGRLFENSRAAHRRAVNLIRLKAEHASEDIRTQLRAVRLAQVRDETLDLKDETAALEQREDQLNLLRRALAKEQLNEGIRADLATLVEVCIAELDDRLRELEVLIEYRRDARHVGEWVADKEIVLHLALDIGDRGPSWGIEIGETNSGLPGGTFNNAGYYVALFGALAQSAASLREADPAALEQLEMQTLAVRLGPPLFFPSQRLHGGLVASRFGVYGLRLGTCHDTMPWAGHPGEDARQVDLDRIAAIARDARPLIASVVNEPAFSLRRRIRPTADYVEPEWANGKVSGYNVMVRSESAALATRPARGAMIGKIPLESMAAFDLAPRYVIDQNGSYVLGPMPVAQSEEEWCAALFDDSGRISIVNSAVSTLKRIEMFPCRSYTVVSLAPPSLAMAESLVLNALNDGQFRSSDFLKMEEPPTLQMYVPRHARSAKVINPFGMTLLNADDEHPHGVGIRIGRPTGGLASEPRGARDMVALNAYRLDVLRQRRIHNDAQEWVHGLAVAALERGSSLDRLAERYANFGAARRLAQRVYKPLLGTMNDLVKAVVILLLLTIPFAYSLERLLVGTPHIYRQIAWYVGFFVLTFAVLYNVHPAFSIAAQPAIIFLAFVVILLSAIVMAILLSRFRTEIKAVQGLQSTVHAADVSRVGTFMAAVTMGISTMRRRPVRTILTTLTVILLTFSILSFASFETQQGILRRYVNSAQETRSIFIHNTLWQALPEQVLDIVRRMDEEVGEVTARRWLAPLSSREATTFGLLLAREDGAETVAVDALVGLDPVDLKHLAELRECLAGADGDVPLSRDGIFLPESAAEQLEVSTGDRVLVRGVTLVVAGVFDERQLMRFTQIEATPVFPVDYRDPSLAARERELTEAEDAEAAERAERQGDSAFLPYLSANQVGIVHVDSVRSMGGALVAISAYPEAQADMESLAEQLSRVCPSPVFASLPDGVYRLFYTTVLETAGMGNLLIPILLGGLIIFGTMLGSVTDREREIYSFSALGLAPPHIGMLFFAEAAVYAVVGGLGGYILSQVVVACAAWLAQFTNLRVPEMNFSSTNAIVAILIVMGTVMLSTVYPAFRGSRSANPGLARRWQLPRPPGDTWEFTFPFTVSEYDVTGVMAFLQEHFENFSDCSLGVFLAQDTRIEVDGRSLILTSNIATAPFDLGVTQTFRMASLPSEIEGVDEVQISISRRSGTRGDWLRTNRPFIGDLRKQFLIWRSLPVETMELYRGRTLSTLGRETHAKDEDHGDE